MQPHFQPEHTDIGTWWTTKNTSEYGGKTITWLMFINFGLKSGKLPSLLSFKMLSFKNISLLRKKKHIDCRSLLS